MPAGREPGEDVDEAERIAADAETLKAGWERTLSEMETMAENLREEGVRAVTVAAGDTTPKAPEAGESDRFGLVVVVGDDDADAVERLLEDGALPEYDLFRRTMNRRVFFVVLLSDPEGERALLVAGQYRLADATGLAKAAREAGETYTHLQRLDGSDVTTFRHEEPEKFFPEELWSQAE